jgi:Flp pilus assembly protein TadD
MQTSAGELLKKANRLKRENQLDEAIALYHQVIEINPNFAWAYHNLGDAFVKRGNLNEAIVYYRQGLEIIPNSPSFNYSLGSVYWKTGDLEAATQYLEKVIDLQPDFGKSYQLLGQTLTQKGEFERATIAYSKVAQLNPGLSKFQTTLGVLSHNLAKSKNTDVNNTQKTLKRSNFASQVALTSLNNSTMHLLHQKLWNLLARKKEPVLVLGMHNSGTSILAEILHKSGIFLGANMDHYESYFFSIFINNNLLMGGGSNWAQVPIMSVEKVKAFSDQVKSYIRNFWVLDYLQCGYDGEYAWGFKDPRLCVLLPLYLDIFPDSKVIHIRRNPNDVAASLCKKKKLGIGRVNNFDYWKKLTLQHTDRVLECASSCKAYYELTYEDLCRDSEKTVLQLFDFLDLRFTEQTKNLLKKIHSSRIGS